MNGTCPATYRLIRFDLKGGPRWIGVAWNYKHAVLISTRDEPDYATARAELEIACALHMVELRYFDGEYRCDGASDQLVPV